MMADDRPVDTTESDDTDIDKQYNRMMEEKKKSTSAKLDPENFKILEDEGQTEHQHATHSNKVKSSLDDHGLKDADTEEKNTLVNVISTPPEQNDKAQYTTQQEELNNEYKKENKAAKDTTDGAEEIIPENGTEVGKQSTITTEKIPFVNRLKDENTDPEIFQESSQSIQDEGEASDRDIEISNESTGLNLTQKEDDNAKSEKCIPSKEPKEGGDFDDIDSLPTKIQNKEPSDTPRDNRNNSPKPVKEKIEMVKRNHIIGFALSLTIFISGFYVIPIPTPTVNSFAERLTFTFRWLFFSSFTVIHGIMLVANIRVNTPAIDPLNGNMEHLVEVPNRYLRNTVEQIILHIFGILMLGTYLKAESMKAIPVLVFLFVLGRVLYWQGYSREAMKRGIGFVLSFYPTMIVYLYCIGCVMLQGQGYGFESE